MNMLEYNNNKVVIYYSLSKLKRKILSLRYIYYIEYIFQSFILSFFIDWEIRQ